MAMTYSPANLGIAAGTQRAADPSRAAGIDALTAVILLPFTALAAVSAAISSVWITGGDLNAVRPSSAAVTAVTALVAWLISCAPPTLSVGFALRSVARGGTRVSQAVALCALVVALLLLTVLTLGLLI